MGNISNNTPSVNHNPKPPPEDKSAEMATLGSMMLDIEGNIRAEMLESLKATDFYTPEHLPIFSAIAKLHRAEKPVDMVLVRDELKKQGQFEQIGGVDYLTQLVESTPSDANGVYYARIVQEKSINRAAFRLGDRLIEAGRSHEPIDGQFSAIQDDLGGLIERHSPRPALTCLADVKIKSIEWLWPGKFPLGKTILIGGDPGLGKSVLSLAIASHISCGKPWPDTPDPILAGDVVLLSGEDAVEDTIAPRLFAMGADLGRIHLFETENIHRNSGRTFTLTHDLPMLDRALSNLPDCRLAIIDPIGLYLGKTDSHKDAEVRAVLAPLGKLAVKHHISLIAITHLNKSSGTNPLYRMMGSIGMVAAPRSAWCVVRDEDDPERRLMLSVKNNLAKDEGAGIGFRINDVGGSAALAWDSQPVVGNAQDHFEEAANGKQSGAKHEAAEFLGDILKHGPVKATEVEDLAKKAGLSWSTVKRAKEEIGVKIRRDKFGEGAFSWWSLTA